MADDVKHYRVVPALHGIVFEREGDFQASDDAVAFIKSVGFSIGPMQRGSPRACMFGDYVVSKWRNLDADERRETHATLTGDGRNGPLTFRLLPAAPDAAIMAIARATGAAS